MSELYGDLATCIPCCPTRWHSSGITGLQRSIQEALDTLGEYAAAMYPANAGGSEITLAIWLTVALALRRNHCRALGGVARPVEVGDGVGQRAPLIWGASVSGREGHVSRRADITSSDDSGRLRIRLDVQRGRWLVVHPKGYRMVGAFHPAGCVAPPAPRIAVGMRGEEWRIATMNR